MQKVLFMNEIIVTRPLYMNKLRPYIGKQVIKILTGQRRVGKSYILNAVAQEIISTYPGANIISINLENFAYAHIKDAQTLYDEISKQQDKDARNFIFLDEIQEVEGFDKVVRSLNLDPSNDIYLTGSNSSMLSSEMASRLAGRSVEIRVHPLTYSEFLDFHQLQDTDDSLDCYMRFGGLPYLINLPNRNNWNEYISGITDAVVYRDVVARHTLRNTDFLQRLQLFLADNIGQIFTAKRIADYLKSQRMSVSVAVVQSYISYMEQAYIINKVRRWDIEGKRFFEIGEKAFYEDIGIRNSIVGYRPNDVGAVMENIVYNHLVANGYIVSIGVLTQGKEVDFIAQKGGEYKYIQVTLNMYDNKTAHREFGNLMSIPDNYDKIVITLRDTSPNTLKGIKMVSLRQFLTENI